MFIVANLKIISIILKFQALTLAKLAVFPLLRTACWFCLVQQTISTLIIIQTPFIICVNKAEFTVGKTLATYKYHCVLNLCNTSITVTVYTIKFKNLETLQFPYLLYLCTGLFISPSGISELDCATTKTDTAERSISIDRESLQVFFVLGALPYFQVPPLGGSREEKWRSQWIRKRSVS